MSSKPAMAPVDKRIHDNNDTHLWMAVMDRAVRDLVALERIRKETPEVIDDPVFRYDYRSVKKWFYSSSMEPGNFNWICSLVDIDPSWALARLEDRLQIGLTNKAKIRESMQPSVESHEDVGWCIAMT
jgi:hypothetical protein